MDRLDRLDRGGYGLMSSFGDGSLSGELSGFFFVEGEGGDVGGGGGHLGVDVAGVGGDVGGFGDGGGDVAVELDFVACPGGGIGEDDVVGGAEGVGGDAHVLVFVVHDDVDLSESRAQPMPEKLSVMGMVTVSASAVGVPKATVGTGPSERTMLWKSNWGWRDSPACWTVTGGFLGYQ